MPLSRLLRTLLLVATACAIAGCGDLPSIGPGRREIQEVAAPGTQAVQIIDVDDAVARKLLGERQQRLFSETLGQAVGPEPTIGAGDSLEVNIWEAPPAALFGVGVSDPRAADSVRATTMPEQTVDREGSISVPFAGRIHAAGMSPDALETEIVRRLKGKANQPEVVVRIMRNASSNVTVVGEVTNSLRMPLTPGGERLLDALAAAGGVRQPINKITLQVTRGDAVQSMPLDRVIRDPRQNVPLRAGDVVTAMFQPLSFTALGATNKNDEISFETQGITLAQALARSGGLVDTRSDPQGVFIFRLEQPGALDWPHKPVVTTPDGLVPVVYRVDLKDPHSFFVMQSFAINDRDVLYVSNAPIAEVQKFLNVVFSVAYPVLNAVQISR
jgi:polysaccharide export outer membrane protein